MIKTQALYIKIIFKTYLEDIKNKLKTFHILNQTFILQNIKE